MSRRISLFAATAILTALGCAQRSVATEPGIQVSLAEAGDSLPLKVGKPVAISGGPRLTLGAVKSDSRCPSNVECVWAGDAAVEITADPPCYPACLAPSLLLTLHTNLDPRDGVYSGFAIRLLALEPWPLAGKPIEQSQYVAWVRVTATPR